MEGGEVTLTKFSINFFLISCGMCLVVTLNLEGFSCPVFLLFPSVNQLKL